MCFRVSGLLCVCLEVSQTRKFWVIAVSLIGKKDKCEIVKMVWRLRCEAEWTPHTIRASLRELIGGWAGAGALGRCRSLCGDCPGFSLSTFRQRSNPLTCCFFKWMVPIYSPLPGVGAGELDPAPQGPVPPRRPSLGPHLTLCGPCCSPQRGAHVLNEPFGLSLLASSGQADSWGRLHENTGCEASLKRLFAACCYMNVHEARLLAEW